MVTGGTGPSREELEAIGTEHDERWRALDPLLQPPQFGPVEQPDLVVRSGSSVALGQVRVEEIDAEEEGALWGALRTWRLRMRLAGPDRQAAFAGLLDGFDDLLLERQAPGDDDTAGFVAVPSRDVELALPLTRRGFVPTTVVAVRRAGESWQRHAPTTDAAPAEPAEVRAANHHDLSQLEALAPELNRFDANFGMVTSRPALARHMSQDLAGALEVDEPWLWVAVIDDEVVGFCRVQPPGEASWIAQTVNAPADELAYLGMLYVRPQDRLRGVGAQLVAAAHTRLDASGVGLTLLHHSLPNPYSTPFWARHGYRPLWTAWQRRPLRPTLRLNPGDGRVR